MVSIGTEAHVTKLIADSIEVAGAVVSGNKQFGPELNQGELHHNGSVFFCKWSAVHQCASLATTSGSTTVTWTTSAAHGLAQNDTIHIGSLPNNPCVISEINAVPASELSGTHTVTAVPSTTTFSYAVTTNADTTGSSTLGVPHVRIDRYKSIDMATNATTWTHTTTLPAPTHTNTENFFF